MNRSLLCKSLLSGAAVLLAASAPRAQVSPRLRATASVPVVAGGGVLTFDTVGDPGRTYAVLSDGAGGPIEVGGLELRLAASSALVVAVADVLPPGGFQRRSLVVPADPTLAGIVLYHQALVLGGTATAPVLQASNGESSILRDTVAAIVERFDDPVAEGYTGDFDPASIDTIRGVIERRTVRPVDGTTALDPLAVPVVFGQGIQSPLDPRGNRTQFVVREREIGGPGSEEVVTDIRWRPFSGFPLQPDQFQDVEIRLSHSQVVPNYTVGSFTALPEFPLSGLSETFATNPSSPEVLVRSGGYAIDPQDLTASGFLSYDLAGTFTYNGVDSLLIDVRTFPDPNAAGVNGHQIFLPIQSSPDPFTRIFAALPIFGQGTLDPNAVTSGQGDNSIYDIEIDLARITATATSPFRPSGLQAPDYEAPLVAAITPGQSSISLRFRGADDAFGSGVTAWSSSVDVADGKPFLQISIDLTADLATGALPEIDTLVVPAH